MLQKPVARQVLGQFLAGLKNTVATRSVPSLYVRINALDTGLTLQDLAAVMPYRPDGVVLPKCRSASDLERLSHYLDAFEAMYTTTDATRKTRIVAIVTETADSLAGLDSYAKADNPRLVGLMWGAEDLSGDIGALASKEADSKTWTPIFEHARTSCLLAAAAAGVIAIDAVFTNIHDIDALRSEAQHAYRDGFGAKAAIHPAQVPVINESMSPSAEMQEWARQVVDAFEKSDQVGVATLNGKMLDKPHLRLARRILQITSSAER